MSREVEKRNTEIRTPTFFTPSGCLSLSVPSSSSQNLVDLFHVTSLNSVVSSSLSKMNDYSGVIFLPIFLFSKFLTMLTLLS